MRREIDKDGKDNPRANGDKKMEGRLAGNRTCSKIDSSVDSRQLTATH